MHFGFAEKYSHYVRTYIPTNTRRRPDAGLTLAHFLRRWPNMNTTSGQRLVFAGVVST